LVAVANIVLGSRRLIVLLGVAGATLGAVLALTTPRTYTSSTRFMPQSARGTSNPYAAMAAQFGIAPGAGAGDPTSSPAFYLDLLRSRPILRAAVEKPYDVVDANGRSRTVSLVQRAGTAATPAVVERAMQSLSASLDARASPATSVITLRVTNESPGLAQQIAAHLIELLNGFDRDIRKSQAAAERRMLEQRTLEAREDLNAAEARLLDFLVRNRNYNNSPELNYQHGRLSREVSNRQQLYIALAQSYEKARIDEIRDTPLLTVIEPANVPTGPNARWTVLKTIVGGLVGVLLALFIAFARAVARRNSGSGSLDEAEFEILWRDTLRDLRHPWRLLGGARG
jgi:uncharacterized protein involved in exopolysaccharide biosynthesis